MSEPDRYFACHHDSDWSTAVGPFPTRAEAVANPPAREDGENGDFEDFHTALARPWEPAVDGHDLFDWLSDRVAEGDVYGDVAFVDRVTSAQQDDLGERLTAALRAWLGGIGMTRWHQFVEVVEHPYPPRGEGS